MSRSSPPLPLAYVFWHWPQASAPVAAYEGDLAAFHASLARHPPAGFLGSTAFAVDGASWLPRPLAYEDWYLVHDWTALGDLGGEATARRHVRRHDQVAHQSAAGAGAVYGLVAGEVLAEPATVTWLAKPPGWTYGDLDAALAPLLGEGSALWRRQLVLGPAPELCLQTGPDLSLPAGLHGQRVSRRVVR